MSTEKFGLQMITWVGLQKQTPFPCLSSHTKITLRKLGKSCKKTNNKTGGYQIVSTVWQELWKGLFPTICLVYLWDFKTRKKGISKKLSDIFLKLIFFLNTHFFLLLINRTGRRRHSSTDAFFFFPYIIRMWPLSKV